MAMGVQATLVILNGWLEDMVGITLLEEAISKALVEGMSLVMPGIAVRVVLVIVVVFQTIVAHVDQGAVGKAEVVEDNFVGRVIAVTAILQQTVVASQATVVAVARIARLSLESSLLAQVLLIKNVAYHLFDGGVGKSTVVGTGRADQFGGEFATELCHVRVMMRLPSIPERRVVPEIVRQVPIFEKVSK